MPRGPAECTLTGCSAGGRGRLEPSRNAPRKAGSPLRPGGWSSGECRAGAVSEPGQGAGRLAQAQSARGAPQAAPAAARRAPPRPAGAGEPSRWPRPRPRPAEEAEGDDVIERGDGHWAPF